MMRELRSSINVIKKKKKTNELKNINISEGSQGKHCTIWWIRYEAKNILKDKEGEYELVEK